MREEGDFILTLFIRGMDVTEIIKMLKVLKKPIQQLKWKVNNVEQILNETLIE